MYAFFCYKNLKILNYLFLFSSPVDFGNFYSEKMKILDASNSFSIMAFAFMTHHNSFLIYNSLKNPNYSDWKKVVI